MKTIHPILATLGAILWMASPGLHAQPFNSGSNGSYGPLNVTANTTLQVPPDGIFHCTTITVAAGTILTFKRNALNTPVYLLATGDVVINGLISLDGTRGNNLTGGQGGPGGFDGGQPGAVGTQPGDGHGPGAGRAGDNNSTATGAGAGAYGLKVALGGSTRHGDTYGSALLVPLVGGSGGGGTIGTPGTGGGGAGGAILVASSTRIQIAGGIRARGGTETASAYNFGSGGAIRLVAPQISGNGGLDVRAREGNSNLNGDGRIRIDTQDRSQVAFGLFPSGTASLGSLMVVFPSPLPRLDILEAAGTTIPLDSGPVSVLLPFNSPATQKIRVQAKDFGQSVPVRVVLTPDHGAAKIYDVDIDNRAVNPAEVSLNVDFPINVQTSVEVWTR